jgi:L-lysine 2,3-aminomutase
VNYIAYNNTNFKETPYYQLLSKDLKEEFDVLTNVFHFKINNYVSEHLIDWSNIPNDPIFRLVFPGKEMLNPMDYTLLKQIIGIGGPNSILSGLIRDVQAKMSPRLKQTENSYARINGRLLKGMYRNASSIINLCPRPMVKTCHAYCSYCFRWLMLGNPDVQNYSSYDDPQEPIAYLKAHPEVTDVLFTGADPLVLNAETLKKYISPVLEVGSVQVIRISSKSLAWWPYRFTTDKDADALLELFEYIRSKGKHFNFCAHFTHSRELESDEVKKAIQRINASGAVIRCQGPLVKGINDTPGDWVKLWTKQVNLGMIPYYMFMEAKHNTENCFRVPLAKALDIFQAAQKQATNIARTVRGPVFMNDLHRVLLDGTTDINGQKYFVLKNLQTPPGIPGEGQIKLIPYDGQTKDAGELFELFNPME